MVGTSFAPANFQRVLLPDLEKAVASHTPPPSSTLYRIGVSLAVMGALLLTVALGGGIALAIASGPVVGLLVTGGVGMVILAVGAVLIDCNS